MEVPLFPLRTVLFPGGLLPIKIFEQRYIDMASACLRDEAPFGVCLIEEGDEVIDPRKGKTTAPQIASIGTVATITACDSPQLGILHVKTLGGSRFEVRAQRVQGDGLLIGDLSMLPDEPAMPFEPAHQPLAKLLEMLIERVGPQHFAPIRAYENASWVGHRLAELLPLPLTIKQSMLEINDSAVRLLAIAKFLRDEGIL
jgi:Lon protease-like protein